MRPGPLASHGHGPEGTVQPSPRFAGRGAESQPSEPLPLPARPRADPPRHARFMICVQDASVEGNREETRGRACRRPAEPPRFPYSAPGVPVSAAAGGGLPRPVRAEQRGVPSPAFSPWEFVPTLRLCEQQLLLPVSALGRGPRAPRRAHVCLTLPPPRTPRGVRGRRRHAVAHSGAGFSRAQGVSPSRLGVHVRTPAGFSQTPGCPPPSWKHRRPPAPRQPGPRRPACVRAERRLSVCPSGRMSCAWAARCWPRAPGPRGSSSSGARAARPACYGASRPTSATWPATHAGPT